MSFLMVKNFVTFDIVIIYQCLDDIDFNVFFK